MTCAASAGLAAGLSVQTYQNAFADVRKNRSQFNIPVQKRVARDVAKRLESMQKWGSKITGVMPAGAGMLCFVARAGLGSGPNLSLTILYLSLLHLVDHKFPLGLHTCFSLHLHVVGDVDGWCSRHDYCVVCFCVVTFCAGMDLVRP